MRPWNHILLSHHVGSSEAHCLVLGASSVRCLVCARCAGIIVGLLLGALVQTFDGPLPHPLMYPLALVDWLVCCSTGWRGTNSIRVGSGVLLGLCQLENWIALVDLEWAPCLAIADLLLLWGFAVGIGQASARHAPPSTGEAGLPPRK